MDFLAYAVLILMCLAGFIAVFFTGPGTLLVLLGAVLFAIMTRFSVLDPWTLVLLLALYLFGEFMEYAATVIGAKRLGASNTAIVGAIAGGIFGAVIGSGWFIVGIIPGTLIGIFLGAFVLELLVRRDWRQSLKSGIGSLVGRAGSLVAKVAVVLCMFAVMAIKFLHP
ncbi:MAG: DUF456 domain-containing protein [Candidatus Omnitrophota bacterium]